MIVIQKGRSDRTALKAALITVFLVVILVSALVTFGFLYRRIKLRKQHDKSGVISPGISTPRRKVRPIPSVGSRIRIVSEDLSMTSPRIDLTQRSLGSAQEVSQVSIETEGNQTKSHLLIEDNENMIFRLKSSRSHSRHIVNIED